MIGGGEGAFIGNVHRMAARLDGRYQLVAGVFSSDAEKTKRSAVALGVDPARAYPSVDAMIAGEQARADGIEVVSIVTPNHVHYAQSAACLEAGLDVICDKPLTTTLADAEKLVKLASEKKRLLGVRASSFTAVLLTPVTSPGSVVQLVREKSVLYSRR